MTRPYLIAIFYGVSKDYLMGVSEMKNHSGTDLTGLHLGDDMMNLLASGRITNRLLCEIVTMRIFSASWWIRRFVRIGSQPCGFMI